MELNCVYVYECAHAMRNAVSSRDKKKFIRNYFVPASTILLATILNTQQSAHAMTCTIHDFILFYFFSRIYVALDNKMMSGINAKFPKLSGQQSKKKKKIIIEFDRMRCDEMACESAKRREKKNSQNKVSGATYGALEVGRGHVIQPELITALETKPPNAAKPHMIASTEARHIKRPFGRWNRLWFCRKNEWKNGTTNRAHIRHICATYFLCHFRYFSFSICATSNKTVAHFTYQHLSAVAFSAAAPRNSRDEFSGTDVRTNKWSVFFFSFVEYYSIRLPDGICFICFFSSYILRDEDRPNDVVAKKPVIEYSFDCRRSSHHSSTFVFFFHCFQCWMSANRSPEADANWFWKTWSVCTIGLLSINES